MVARAEAARATEERVMDVAVELFTERAYEDVSLEDVASRAGIAKRTVLRRFGSKDELFVRAGERAGMAMQAQRNEAPSGDVAAGVASVIEQYERWGDYRLRLLAEEDRIPVVARDVELGRRYHWSWVERTFAPLIDGRTGRDRKERIATLVLLTDLYTWKLLRRDLGFSRAATERMLVDLIGRVAGEG